MGRQVEGVLPALVMYAIAVSLLVPATFLLFGPVKERRTFLGLTYGAVVALSWCASLTLGFLSPVATAGAAALLATIGVFVALSTFRDEQILARIDAQLDSPEERAHALDDLRALILDVRDEGPTVVALMEVAGYPVKSLLTRGLYDEALAILDFIDTQIAPRLGADDAGEATLLRARTLLHLGRIPEAEALLRGPVEKHLLYREEGLVLRALIALHRGDLDEAREHIDVASIGRWATWSQPPAQLAAAHLAAARGDSERAIRVLLSIPRSARERMFDLARAVAGPASELAQRLQGPAAPYR